MQVFEQGGAADRAAPLAGPGGPVRVAEVSRWLNEAANRARVERALARLGELRVGLGLEGDEGGEAAGDAA